MGRRSSTSSFIMNSKACLLVFGFLLVFVILACAGEENYDNSLSEEIESSRVVRDTDAVKKSQQQRRKKGKKGRKLQRKKKTGKKAKKNNNKNRSIKRNNKNNKRRKRKGKKSIKKQKKNSKKRQSAGSKRMEGRTVDGKCLESAVKSMRKLEKVVANFDKQMIRVEKQAAIAAKKGDKKAVFGPIALKLIDVGGGNESALTCAGSSDSAGAERLKNLTDTLMLCETEVNKTCKMDIPKPNATLITACNTSTKAFRKMAEECFSKSKEDTAMDACTCWTNADLAKLGDSVADCKIKEVGTVAKGLKACKDAFAKCRKFEDDAVSIISACSKDTTKLKEKAAQLNSNNKAMTEAQAKIKKTTGTRKVRAVATTCEAFIKLVEELVKVASKFQASPKIVTIVKDITDSADPTCTDAQKNSLKEQKSAVDKAAKRVEKAFNNAQTQLEAATGSTLSSTDLDNVQSGTTTKAARLRRDRLQQFMNNV